MNQVYWLDPIRRGDLLRAVLQVLAGDARVAVEGEVQAIEALGLLSLPGASKGPSPPFSRQHAPDSLMLIMPLQNGEEARQMADMVLPGSRLSAGVEAIQIERHGSIEFLTGDGFQVRVGGSWSPGGPAT